MFGASRFHGKAIEPVLRRVRHVAEFPVPSLCTSTNDARAYVLVIRASSSASKLGTTGFGLTCLVPTRVAHGIKVGNHPGRVTLDKPFCSTRVSDDGQQQQPPMIVRAGLVGSATALMTPLMPIIGFNQLAFRFLDPATRMALTGGSSMLFFSVMTLIPNSFYYAPLLLPFAVGNGMTAASFYLAADAAIGGPKILDQRAFGLIPIAGPLLGIATALASPFTFPLCWDLCFGWQGNSISSELYSAIYHFCYNSWMLPCLAVTGSASGLLIHLALKPLVVGVPGWPWQKLAGAVLAASVCGMMALYSTSLRSEVEHLRDINLDNPAYHGWFPKRAVCYVNIDKEICWVPGLDHQSGEVVSLRHKFVPRGTKNQSKGLAYDYDMSETISSEKGITRFKEAKQLLAKAASARTRVYKSRQDAYFDGLAGMEPIASKSFSQMQAALPVSKSLATDFLVCFVAGKIPHGTLMSKFNELGPFLAHSMLAKSRDAQSALSEIAFCAAQFRELCRLEAGAAPGPHKAPNTAEALSAALTDAGIDVVRAKRSLAQLGWKTPTDEKDAALREADWAVIASHLRHAKLERASDVILCLVGGAIFSALGYLVLR